MMPRHGWGGESDEQDEADDAGCEDGHGEAGLAVGVEEAHAEDRGEQDVEWCWIVAQVADTCCRAGREFLLESTVSFGDEHEDGEDDENDPLEGAESAIDGHGGVVGQPVDGAADEQADACDSPEWTDELHCVLFPWVLRL